MQASTAAVLTAVVVGVAVFALGYFYGLFKKAQAGLVGAKGAVPTARKSYYSSLWMLMKWGAGAVLIVLVLVTWAVRDVSDAAEADPTPSPSVSSRR